MPSKAALYIRGSGEIDFSSWALEDTDSVLSIFMSNAHSHTHRE